MPTIEDILTGKGVDLNKLFGGMNNRYENVIAMPNAAVPGTYSVIEQASDIIKVTIMRTDGTVINRTIY
ncbi:hypothetical protein HY212_00715 [Candidatus Pacearchaeota archaeon]|nr:hypothetical protein [Candidatus Pacearchaeota archaeon]